MRLISQNGHIDIPYDEATLYLDKTSAESTIYRIRAVVNDKDCVLAEYSTYEQAKEEMLEPALMLGQWAAAYVKPNILSSMPGYIAPAPQFYIFKQEKSQEETELIKTVLEQSI